MSLVMKIRAAAVLVGLLALSLGTGASAAPVTYSHTGGSATLTVTLGSDPTIVGTATLPIVGTFATFDDATIELVDFEFQAEGTIPFAAGVTWGGFGDIVLTNATINPGAGYGHDAQVDMGSGQYLVSVSPVQISTTVTASSSTDLWDASPISGQGPLSATVIVFGTGNQNISITGITIGQIRGDSVYLQSPEFDDLIIKADLVFEGQVPEPGVGILLGMAGVSLLSSRRLRNR